MEGSTGAQLHAELEARVRSTPIIDNHAHPLIQLPFVNQYPLLAVATEAHGSAIPSSRSGLPHFRAVQQLARALGCRESWEAVEEAIHKRRSSAHSYHEWTKQCLRGIETVLVDDGLDDLSKAEAFHHFQNFVPSKCKRILRIEQVLPEVIEASLRMRMKSAAFFNLRMTAIRMFDSAIQDPDVIGFKSVICYRTGLDIPFEMDEGSASKVFGELWDRRQLPDFKEERFTKLSHPGLSEWFVHLLAERIDAAASARKKPIQFHTGLGDNDLTLTRASPAHLQQFIRRWPNVPIVLLHSGYPFVRETGYLAAMYPNVYADIGEVFPFLSRGGQENVFKQILELCPGEKILWSTDGHWFPETYLLAVEQMCEVFATVLTELVEKKDLTQVQAITLIQDVLFNNSNHLYNLGLKRVAEEASVGRGSEDESKDMSKEQASGFALSPKSKMQALSSFLAKDNPPRFLRVYFSDMTGTPRVKSIPIQRAISSLERGEDITVGITHAALGILQNDVAPKGVSCTGEWRLHPDYSSLLPGPREGHLTAFGNFKEIDGRAVPLCPRSLLQRTVSRAAALYDMSFLLGFEIELVILRRSEKGGLLSLRTDGHAWSVSRALDHDVVVSVLEPAILMLEEAGIHIEGFHAESAPGQYEVILPPESPVRAIDNLLYAREVISNHAVAKGYRMTLHPKPFADAAGTAAHVHISLSTPEDPKGKNPAIYEPFYAGILNHLRAIAAFTYSNKVSYERVVDGCWAGGTWIAWGTQNRETPLRKIEGSHWELKCMDGLANPYLALSAILSAGLDGINSGARMTWKDCSYVPGHMSEEARSNMGITTSFPKNIIEALTSLAGDRSFRTWLGEELVDRYIKVKEAEDEMMAKLDLGARQWIMERY